ncbi:dTMP kinase [bacterium]|nr:dTMP kinase [candidate division CSSED10-310 bacterium]
MSTGFFISFEGVEGCGKSTQIRILRDRLKSENMPVRLTREPGDGEMGGRIRELLLSVSSALDPLTELFLLAADRTRHVTEIVRPGLAAGDVVLSDRYADSSVAYQGYGRELPLDFVHLINSRATGGLVPDLTFLMDIDPEISLRRSRIRLHQQNMFEAEGRFETECLAFHRRVREGYLRIARDEPGRYAVLDGTLPVENLSETIAAIAIGALAQRKEMETV